jgi:hypothetical protein
MNLTQIKRVTVRLTAPLPPVYTSLQLRSRGHLVVPAKPRHLSHLKRWMLYRQHNQKLLRVGRQPQRPSNQRTWESGTLRTEKKMTLRSFLPQSLSNQIMIKQPTHPFRTQWITPTPPGVRTCSHKGRSTPHHFRMSSSKRRLRVSTLMMWYPIHRLQEIPVNLHI